MKISLLALTLGSLGVVQGLKLQQMSLFVAGLIAIAITLLVADYAVAAGILLAMATIKPQLVGLLLLWLAIWTVADWRRRYRWAISFLATMAILMAASEWYLPHWIFHFGQAVREYRQYTAVINEGSMNDILRYIEIGKKDGRLITGGARDTSAGEGYFIKPTVIADIPPKSKLEQEEVFGPVLAVIKSRNFDHALEIANDTEFGLTGAVYSSSREKLDRAVREFHVGNLYLNRKCTGAMVGAHPFGGFNMSGTDSKSGGPDYLYLFTQAKSVGEKI